MATSTVSPNRSDQEHEIWDSLKLAIASSSGFRRWQEEQPAPPQNSQLDLEQQVRHYLRETLETLAY